MLSVRLTELAEEVGSVLLELVEVPIDNVLVILPGEPHIPWAWARFRLYVSMGEDDVNAFRGDENGNGSSY
jgi:hypothetical protein